MWGVFLWKYVLLGKITTGKSQGNLALNGQEKNDNYFLLARSLDPDHCIWYASDGVPMCVSSAQKQAMESAEGRKAAACLSQTVHGQAACEARDRRHQCVWYTGAGSTVPLCVMETQKSTLDNPETECGVTTVV